MLQNHALALKPEISDSKARERFADAARRLSLDPDNLWVGGYVDYEWHHGRHVYETADITISGATVLEFGCNFGATSVILSALGANVVGVDVNENYVELAQLNIASYGLEQRATVQHVRDTTRLPFEDRRFDLITCNSVLEYVPHSKFRAIQCELDRVLKPGGTIIVLGTSNRLWPREVHSGKWLVNYLPRWVDTFFSTSLQRGILPWQVHGGFWASYQNVELRDGSARYIEARRRMGASHQRLKLVFKIARLLYPFRITIGMLTPSICLLLRKNVA